MFATENQAKEVFLSNGESFRYVGDSDHGLVIETAESESVELSTQKISEISGSFSGHNPLLDDPRVSPDPSLARFIAWVTDSEAGFAAGPLSRETAERVLLVFMGEGIVGMGGHVQSPTPEDFPPAPAHECLTQLRGRPAVYVDRPFIAEVEVKEVSIETQAENHEYAKLTLVTRQVLASRSNQPPNEFTIGCEVKAATRRMGSLSAPYLSWQLVIAPGLVDDILDLAETCESSKDLLRTIRRML